MLTEEILYDEEGLLLSNSTWKYKIPSSQDIPIHSSHNLFSKVPNYRSILRSKAAGEAPMCLTITIFLAVKNALQAARRDFNLFDKFAFHPPATPQNILLALGTSVKQLLL